RPGSSSTNSLAGLAVTNATASQTTVTNDAPRSAESKDTALKNARLDLAVLRSQRARNEQELGDRHPVVKQLDGQISRLESLVPLLEDQQVDQRQRDLHEVQRQIEIMQGAIPAWQDKVLRAGERLSEGQRLRDDVRKEQDYHDRLLSLLDN